MSLARKGSFWTAFATFFNVKSKDEADLLIITGDNPVNMVFSARYTEQGVMSVHEGVDVSRKGDELSVIANERASQERVETVAFSSPRVTDLGREIASTILPGGSGGNALGGVAVGPNEWLLLPKMVYLLRFKPDSNGTDVTLSAQFLEQQDIEKMIREAR